MGTTIEDLKEWYERGKEKKAAFMLVVCDTFDWEDFPVYVNKDQDVRKELTSRDGPNMAKVMEVYNLSKPFDEQRTIGGLCWDLG